MKHKTKKTILKTAEVDTKIAPLIKILNSDPEIHTTFCCQGEEENKNKAYIVLYTFTPESLHKILCLFTGHLATITVKLYQGLPRYDIRFPSEDIKFYVTKAKLMKF